MTAPPLSVGANLVIAAADLQPLLAALVHRGYRPVGPTLRDGHFIYGDLASPADLPAGWTDAQ